MEQTAELRASGIGGSDASVILGVNPWKSRLQLHLEKSGELEQVEQTENMYFGQVLESVIADEYSRRTGAKIQRVNDTIRHPDHEWMMAHIDRRVLNVAGGKLLECKTAGTYGAGDWEEGVPEYYVPQIQHYLCVTGWREADVAVLIGGNDFRIFPVMRDDEYIMHLIDEEYKFWVDLQSGRIPDPFTSADIKIMYPEDDGGAIQATDEIKLRLLELAAVKTEIKVFEEKESQLKNEVQKFMGTAALLVDAEGKKLASWKNQDRKLFDSEKFQAENPDVYKQYLSKKSIRVFR